MNTRNKNLLIAAGALGAIATTLILTTTTTTPHTYYVSSGGSTANAGTITAPWSLGKLNSFSPNLKPGDSVLFKRDDIIYGDLVSGASGSSSAPIYYGTYGSGNKPIITSLITLGGWVDKGGGIWEAYNAGLGPTAKMVLVDGVEQNIGRYPNDGYLTIDAFTAKTSITDAALPTTPNFTGADVVIRFRHWILDKSYISNHTGTKITYTTGSTYEPRVGYGYFIQNSLKTLDKFGEWYYSPSTKKLSMYFGNESPSGHKVEVSSKDYLVSTKHSYLTFSNLNIRGADSKGFYIGTGNNIIITNCDIAFSGEDGILMHGHTNLRVEDCTIDHSNNNGIDVEVGDNTEIRNTKITYTMPFAGMSRNGEGMGIGINLNSNNGLVEYSEVIKTGFQGIYYSGNNTILKNNLIDSFCYVKDDGGGIYSHGASTAATGRKVLDNLIMNGMGAGPGTDKPTQNSAQGIYLDNDAGETLFDGNTITKCNAGFNVHSVAGHTARNNLLYDNKIQLNFSQGYIPIRNWKVYNNLCLSNSGQYCLVMATLAGASGDIGLFGKFDSNYYARPIDDNLTLKAVSTAYNLDGWRVKYPQYEKYSKKSPAKGTIRFEYNTTRLNKPITLDANYVDVRGNQYASGTSIMLSPYHAVALIKTGDVVITPPPPTGATLTLTTDRTSYTYPATVKITGTLTNNTKTISKVQFYADGHGLYGDTVSPWVCNWTSFTKGTHIAYAKAFDSAGLLIAQSSNISVTVN